MAALNNYQFPSKYIIDRQYFTKEKFFKGDFRYEDLLILKGDKIMDYDDITVLAKNEFYDSMSLSEGSVHGSSPFYDWLVGNGGTKNIDSNFARWKVFGKPDRRTFSVGNPNGMNTMIGAGGVTFKIQLDTDWYKPQEIIAPVENLRAQILLQSFPRQVPGGYEYEAVTLEQDAFLPAEYFASGKYWTKILGGVTSALAPDTAGSFNAGFGYSYLEFQVPLTTMKKEYSVDRETHLRQGNLRVSRCDVNDKILDQNITNVLEMVFDSEIKREKEMYLTWGSMSTHHIDRTSGKPIHTSPGLFAFLEEGNVYKYNPWVNSIDQIVEIISSFWYDKVPINRRKLVLYTGEAGYQLFNRWVMEKFNGTVTGTGIDFILTKSNKIDPNKEAYSLNNYAFTEYKLPDTFGSVAIAHWPVLDDKIVNYKTMPGSHYTVKSFEFIAMDYGAGKPNVQLLTRNATFDRNIEPGRWSPYGHVGIDNPVFKVGNSSLGYTYKVTHSEQFGLAVQNTQKILRFIPAVD
jgi:hypothetical protein